MIQEKPVKRQRKPKHEWPFWISEALKVLEPPENLTVSEWADKYRILDPETSAEPGPWRTARTPYLREIMDAYLDPDIEEIIFVKCTQVGGTEAINNMIAATVSLDPGTVLIVYPTKELAEYISDKRLQPMMRLSPGIGNKFHENESKLLELQFDGMHVVLVGSNSVSGLASRPIGRIFYDEIDKYPQSVGKEADPISLTDERAKTFTYKRKKVKVSTPTYKIGHIWQAWEKADCQKRYYVPCPHCGTYQTFKFRDGLKWKVTSKNLEEAYIEAHNTAYYECCQCKNVITDFHKQQMLRDGEWRSEKNNGKKKTAYHLNTLYSPWVTFGEIAEKFLRSKDDPLQLMNFINSWLAEPWEQTEARMNSDIVMDRQTHIPEGVVPDGTIVLAGGVDVQRDGFYYTIRAWGSKFTSQNILHGFVSTWNEIEYIMEQDFPCEKGGFARLNICGIDSGDQTDEVYEFCANHSDWATPVKGSSSPLMSKYKMSTIDKVGSKHQGNVLILVDGHLCKDFISGRMKRPNGKGSWMVYKGCDREYAEQVCSEEKVLEKVNGREKYVWKPKSTSARNHYLDCEVYNAAIAELFAATRGINLYLDEYIQPEQLHHQVEQSKVPVSSNDNGYTSGGDWIRSNGSWIR